MREEEIPDYNIFMMCKKLKKNALTALNNNYYFRNCKLEELEIWKAFPFDSPKVPRAYESFMNNFIKETYGDNLDLFFQNTLFVCDQNDKPIATCSYWKVYEKIYTIQWFKTLKEYEGKGIGRALFSAIMKRFEEQDYPILLHTQPGSFRAIKLYSDFGFNLLKGGQLGTRKNELEESLPILKQFIPTKYYQHLNVVKTPLWLIKSLENEKTIQF